MTRPQVRLDDDVTELIDASRAASTADRSRSEEVNAVLRWAFDQDGDPAEELDPPSDIGPKTVTPDVAPRPAKISRASRRGRGLGPIGGRRSGLDW